MPGGVQASWLRQLDTSAKNHQLGWEQAAKSTWLNVLVVGIEWNGHHCVILACARGLNDDGTCMDSR